MAQFRVQIINVINDNKDEIFVTGRRESDASVKRNYGADEAVNYDYYYVKKPNKFGIKWIIMDKGANYGDVIASVGSRLSVFENVRVIKMY